MTLTIEPYRVLLQRVYKASAKESPLENTFFTTHMYLKYANVERNYYRPIIESIKI